MDDVDWAFEADIATTIYERTFLTKMTYLQYSIDQHETYTWGFMIDTS